MWVGWVQGNHWAMHICTHSLHQFEITNREINEQCPNEGSALMPNGPVSFLSLLLTWYQCGPQIPWLMYHRLVFEWVQSCGDRSTHGIFKLCRVCKTSVKCKIFLSHSATFISNQAEQVFTSDVHVIKWLFVKKINKYNTMLQWNNVGTSA